MSQHSPCKLISYRELSQTGTGFALWNSYMEQVRAIALQYPNHFTKVVAKEAITKDAQTHRFYAYLLPENRVTSFCVVVVTYLEAELVWMATHKDYRRKGYASELVRFIEATLFSPNSSISMIIGKPATPDTMLSGTRVGGEKWLGTNLFHKHMGYTFRYKLEDYWEADDHAALFVKRRTPGLFGYVTLKEKLAFPSQATSLKEDRHPVENKAIQQDIRDYIISFRREVTGIRDSVQKIFQDDSELEGFAGVAFVPISNGTATIFAEATQQYSHKIIPKFEYEIDASTLTRILVMKEIPDTGVVFYPTCFDQRSEIKLHDNFRIFLPKLQSPDGYTLFYHRARKDDADSMCVLYFVMPVIRDVVVAKRNWHTLTKYSFAQFMVISEILKALIETHFKNNEYLRSLLNCVPLPTVIDNKYANMYVEVLRQQMSKQINALNQEKLKAKESAIVHFGHSLSHTCSNIVTFFDSYVPDQNDFIGHAAKNAANFINDLLVLLQTANIYTLRELVRHEKVDKFLHITTKDDCLLISTLIEKCKFVASGIRRQNVDGIDDDYFVELNTISEDIEKMMLCAFKYEGVFYRVRQSLLTPLIAELLDNIASHGEIDKKGEKKGLHISVVKRVGISATSIDEQATVVIRNPVINPKCQKGLQAYLVRKEEWQTWPKDVFNSGPGLAVDLLRQIGLGNLYYRMLPRQEGFWFETAVAIKGLAVEEEGNG